MKITHIAMLGLAAFASYKAYQNRDKIRADFAETLTAFDRAQVDSEIIQDQLQIIAQQANLIHDYKKDLTYKFKLINKEAQARLNEINQRMESWRSGQDQV
ncbi:hypothetical protein ACFSN5_09065 [Streptococcus tangpeifui]|uniref:hypothetical protein n=1 Tax=Streptococcus tangpeifui TaxID=2709400 RepID=UPI0013EDFBA0|nr:hypothetical protein [Streptococcus sp. ZJ373]